MENLNAYRSIRTISGKYVNVFEPDPETITIEDIAHALSNQCRFGGHLPRFYSVAQHSVLCWEIADELDKFDALMHDASEAYLLDIPKPIKVELADYNRIEDNLMRLIANKFGFNYPKSHGVEKVDHILLEWEWNVIMLENLNAGFNEIKCMTPRQASNAFLKAFNKEVSKRNFIEIK